MILLDLSHTSHTRARTGIQRVARSLARELEGRGQALATTWDPHLARWRPLAPWERHNLTADEPANSRGARWPLSARLKSRLQRLTGGGAHLPSRAEPAARPASAHAIAPSLAVQPPTSGILLPELFSPAVFAALPQLRAAQPGPVVALFHDAIALRRPELFPKKTVARFPAYLTELARLDGVAAVSEESRRTLEEYWDWLELRERPPLIALPLGIDAPATPVAGRPAGDTPATASPPAPPALLCVCTLEARKNHLALLEACESLWSLGLRFSLHLVGLARAGDSAPVLARITTLQAAGRSLHYSGPVSDAALEQAYAACDFTIYPSLEEGFGLPVAESLLRGKPCVCSGAGALGELSRGGGCLTLGALDAGNLAASLSLLFSTPALAERLRAEAASRRFHTWSEYAEKLQAWMGGLPRRS